MDSDQHKVLDRALRTFEAHEPRWLRDGKSGQLALVCEDEIGGLFKTREEALREGYSRFGGRPFLVREVKEERVPINAHKLQRWF